MYVCMYVCMCGWMDACIHTWKQTYIYINTDRYIHTYTHILYKRICMHVCDYKNLPPQKKKRVTVGKNLMKGDTLPFFAIHV